MRDVGTRGWAFTIGLTAALVWLAAVAAAAAEGGAAAEAPQPSALADLVRASGDNVLTFVVGVVAVIGLYFGRRMGRREMLLLTGGAIVLTLVAIGVSHLGTNDALDFEEAVAVRNAEIEMARLTQGHEAALVELANSHREALSQLDTELQKAQIEATVLITLNDSLDDCLDTINTLAGAAQAFAVMAERDIVGAEVIAVSLGIRLGDIVEGSTCTRPDIELPDLARGGG